MQELAELYCRTGSISLWLQTFWSSQTEKNSYISNFIMISNIFDHQYNFIFSLWVLKNKLFEKYWKKLLLTGQGGGGGCLIMAMPTDACRARHFCVELGILRRTGLFCAVEPGFFVSDECYNSYSPRSSYKAYLVCVEICWALLFLN